MRENGTPVALLLPHDGAAGGAEAARGFGFGLGVDGGVLDADGADHQWVRPRIDVGWVSRGAAGQELALDASAGGVLGDTPLQALFLVGGRGTRLRPLFGLEVERVKLAAC